MKNEILYEILNEFEPDDLGSNLGVSQKYCYLNWPLSLKKVWRSAIGGQGSHSDAGSAGAVIRLVNSDLWEGVVSYYTQGVALPGFTCGVSSAQFDGPPRRM